MGNAQHLIPTLEGHSARSLAKSSGKSAVTQPGPAQTGCAPGSALMSIIWAHRIREKKLTALWGRPGPFPTLLTPTPAILVLLPVLREGAPWSKLRAFALAWAWNALPCAGSFLKSVALFSVTSERPSFLPHFPRPPPPPSQAPKHSDPLYVSWRMYHFLV